MTTRTEALAPARRGGYPRAEFVLAALAVASLALIPVRITTIYSGLPAHPLFLHVPVILVPLAALAGLVFCLRTEWFVRYGVALAIVAVVALAATNLTMGAGIALRNALHLNAGGFGPSALIARHAHAASILRLLVIAFTTVLLVTVLAYRVADGMRTGRAGLDRLLSSSGARAALRAVLAVLAIACGYFVWHTGDIGAKAVWQGRLHGSGAGFGSGGSFGAPGGGGVNGLFGSGGGG